MTAAVYRISVSFMLETLVAIIALIPGGQSLCFALLDRIAATAYTNAMTNRPTPRPAPCPHTVPKSPSAKSNATIAIIIPLLANQIPSLSDLSLTLSSLSRFRQLLIDAAIVVVNDGSYYHRDVSQIAHRHGCVLLRSPVNRGAGPARNLGLDFVTKQMPSVDRIGFVDAGVEVTPEWCRGLRSLDAAANRIHTGPVLTSGDNLFDRYYRSRGTLSPRYVGSDCADILYTPSCCMVWNRKVAKLLRFNPEFASASHEDVELCIRARLAYGIQVVVDPRLIVIHKYGDQCIEDFKNRFARYGSYHNVLAARYPSFNELFSKSRPVRWELPYYT